MRTPNNYAFDFENYLRNHMKFSKKVFGNGARKNGILKHIRKEIDEVLVSKAPDELMEWVDILILGIDGATRHLVSQGLDQDEVIAKLTDALHRKQSINICRDWPEPKSEDEPIEHVR